jgi:DNA-binding protein HU-beta
MNNSDLADKLAASQGITKADARKYVDAVFAAITDAAVAGEEVSLNGFGKFKVKESAARGNATPRPAKRSRSPLPRRASPPPRP